MVSKRSERNHRYWFEKNPRTPAGVRGMTGQLYQGLRRFAAYPWLVFLAPLRGALTYGQA